MSLVPGLYIVLITDKDPGTIPFAEWGEMVRDLRLQVREDHPEVRWLSEEGSGPWFGPQAPNTYWEETVLDK